MKVKDLLSMDIDIDVADDVTDELYIAFCGPLKLTEEGQRKFAEVLEYDVTFHDNGAETIALVSIDGPAWEEKLRKAKRLFESAAGYCSVTSYDKWFM